MNFISRVFRFILDKFMLYFYFQDIKIKTIISLELKLILNPKYITIVL